MAISHVAEAGAMPCKHRPAIAVHYYTTGQDLCRECILSLRLPLPFNTGGLGRMDGQKSPNECSNPPPTLCGEG